MNDDAAFELAEILSDMAVCFKVFYIRLNNVERNDPGRGEFRHFKALGTISRSDEALPRNIDDCR